MNIFEESVSNHPTAGLNEEPVERPAAFRIIISNEEALLYQGGVAFTSESQSIETET